MLQALLGICPYAPASLLLLDPHLPEWLPRISIENLRVGTATVGLHFWRNAQGSTDYEITSLKGPLKVARCSNAFRHISAWVEQVDEFTAGFRVN